MYRRYAFNGMQKLLRDFNDMKTIKMKYILIFIALFFLAWLFPYTGDDWAWGSSIGIKRLSSWFKNYNGRYLGNIIVLFLTRSRILRAVSITFCISGIIWLIEKLSDESRFTLLILVAFAFMPVTLLRQSIVWTSGFANYGISIFITLFAVYEFKVDRIKVFKNNFWGTMVRNVARIFLGLCNTLIIEHLTIYNVLLAVAVVCFEYKRKHKICTKHICYLSGILAGAICMFSNGSYSMIVSGKDDYRTTVTLATFTSRLKDNFFGEIITDGFLNNIVLNVMIAIVCILTWNHISNQNHETRRVIGYISTMVITSFAAFSTILGVGNINLNGTARYFEGLVVIIYVIAIWGYVLVLPVTREKKYHLIFIQASIMIVIAPLSIVTPIGPRCFFASYVFQIWFIVELMGMFPESWHKVVTSTIDVCTIVSITAFCYLVYVYGKIYKDDMRRITRAQMECTSSSIIEVENLPFGTYIWMPDPIHGTIWESRFKLFYMIPDEVTIENK